MKGYIISSIIAGIGLSLTKTLREKNNVTYRKGFRDENSKPLCFGHCYFARFGGVFRNKLNVERIRHFCTIFVGNIPGRLDPLVKKSFNSIVTFIFLF